jgi:hypothetical protein
VWQTCHDLFQISSKPAWFRSHHIFECFPLGGNKDSTMSHQTAPTPHYRQPCPSLYGSITFAHLEENSTMVKLSYMCKKSKGKTCIVEEPSYVKQLSLYHVCKIGLIVFTWHNCQCGTMFYGLIEQCFICSSSDFTMSEDAGIEPRTVAEFTFTAGAADHWAIFHQLLNRRC